MAMMRVIKPGVVTPMNPDGTFGLPIALRYGQEFNSDELVVQQHAYAFAPADVEEATANPGERRTTRRPA